MLRIFLYFSIFTAPKILDLLRRVSAVGHEFTIFMALHVHGQFDGGVRFSPEHQ